MKSTNKKQVSAKQTSAKPFFATKYIKNIKHPRALSLILFVVIFASIGVYLFASSRAAGTATLSLTPSTSSPALDSTFTITIYENSATVAVNAVQADLTYNTSLLQYISTDLATSAFSLTGQNSGGNGTINLGLANTTSRTGSQIVAVITFRAIGTGSAAVNFAGSSAIVNAATQNNELGTATGGTYSIADRTSPTTPSGVTVTSHTATTVTISWTGSTDNIGVTGYNIFRNGTQVGTSTTTSYTNTGVAPGTYSYSVQARDAAGNVSPQSTVLNYTLPDEVAPTVPAGLTMVSNTTNSIRFSWTASTDNVGVTGYRIYRNGTLVGTSTTASYTDTGLIANTTYSYTVAAYDAANLPSAQSTVGSFKTAMKTGDVNGDGAVNIYDLSIMATNFGRAGTLSQGDLNNDGAVNIFDLSILAANWGL